MPTVSIVMPAYNAGQYIGKAIESALAQSFEDFELLVVDDGSTDSTAAEVQRFEDQRVRYFHLENSGGPSKPRNFGIGNARGEYIAFFDSDDIILPVKLEQNVRLLNSQPNVSLVFSNFTPLDVDTPRKISWFEKPNVDAILSKIGKTPVLDNWCVLDRPIFSEILANNFIGTSTVMVRRADLISVGLFNENLVRVEDRDLWLRLAKAGKRFAFTHKVLSHYRVLPQSLSRSGQFLGATIDFYMQLLSREVKESNCQIIRGHLATLSFEYGLYLKGQGELARAFQYQRLALRYAASEQRIKIFKAVIKLPIFALFKAFRLPY